MTAAATLLMLVVGASMLLAPRVGHASGLPSGAGVPPTAHFQSTDDAPRQFDGTLLLASLGFEGADAIASANRITVTLPPTGADGAVSGEFDFLLELPGSLLYELAVGIGEAIGDAVVPFGATATPESEIEIPPGFEDCVLVISMDGELSGASAAVLAGDGSVTSGFSSTGCEDTDLGSDANSEPLTVPASWVATLEGDRLSGTITFGDGGDDTELLFEASLVEASEDGAGGAASTGSGGDNGGSSDGDGDGATPAGSVSSTDADDGETNPFTDFILGDGGNLDVTREEAAAAAAAATGVVALTTLVLVLANAGGAGSAVGAAGSVVGATGLGEPAGDGLGVSGDDDADAPAELNDAAPLPDTIETQGPSPADVDGVDPGVMDPVAPGLEPDVPRVTPLDPGLPLIDADLGGAAADVVAAAPPVAPLSQDVIDRWAALGADGQGRVFDRHGQQIATIDRAGATVDLNGNPIAAMTPEFGVNGFTDANGRVIEYSESGVPMQRTETGSGPAFAPVSDLPVASELRPDLSPAARARWTGVGAGPDGELYGADGSVIGRIDPDGEMRTLDGREITGYGEPDGGRLSEITVDGETVLTPGATPRTVDAADGATGRGDAELADLVQRTEVAQAERAAAQAAGTDVRGPEATGDTRASGPDGATTDAGTQATGADAAGAPPAGDARADAPIVPAGDVPDAPAVPDGPVVADQPVVPDAPAPEGDGPRVAGDGELPRVAADGTEARVAADGPRFGAGLGAAMDAQGLIESVQGDIAAGQGVGTALTRGVASTWAGNTIGELGTGVTDVRMTLLGASVLPNGVNNILPDQFAANTVGTGLDAWSAVVGDTATSLGEGQVSTEELDRFAQGLADRPGADPWAGYARLGDAVGEELGNADMDPATMFGNLAEDLARMDEQDVFVEQALESAAGFEQEAFEGRHGTVLRGLSEATRVATNPPDPEQFAEDSATLARVLWDDVTGSGDSGGMGPGFWEEQAQHANDQIRGVPVVGTAFDGYAQVASGIEEQGLGGFSSEMYEGGAALAEEGALLASEAADQATDAVADYAVATVDTIAGWF